MFRSAAKHPFCSSWVGLLRPLGSVRSLHRQVRLSWVSAASVIGLSLSFKMLKWSAAWSQSADQSRIPLTEARKRKTISLILLSLHCQHPCLFSPEVAHQYLLINWYWPRNTTMTPQFGKEPESEYFCSRSPNTVLCFLYFLFCCNYKGNVCCITCMLWWTGTLPH